MMYAIGFTLVGFAMMEFAGWFIHKYLMHGPLWGIHKTHHQHTDGPFEWNDLFSLFFGSVAVLLIFLGVADFDYRFWLGLGISLYGMSYFFLHDMLIHRRVKWFKRPRKGYLAGIFKAHQAHHATNKKDGSVSFGLFVVPKRYFKRSE
ncbi:MAG: sterol desaturase family protein [Lunatimonas sp.]|uniref:sterol desaturase family protein n=1 Tax=Lunatimonas sp. TaxID=2060141 RepID=UPI00263B1A3A|nr:sterol desaturase family protein [Lunatimonas sp.]MCC5937582.1 sterol desaturase family protein [Lunatimonas sp.]